MHNIFVNIFLLGNYGANFIVKGGLTIVLRCSLDSEDEHMKNKSGFDSYLI